MNALVVFFSASGVTAKVARKLAEAVEAPVYEIKPKETYTAEDLDWRDKQSRSSVEMNDPACRPAMADTDAPVDTADVIFVGFPIWWYREPSIVDTFLEAYDLKEKTIVPFATSGSSEIGDTAKHMQGVVGKKVTVLAGKRFASGVSEAELKKWADRLEV